MFIQRVPKPICPECGSTMRLIPAGRGRTEEPFWSCIHWQRNGNGCDGTRQIGNDGKPIYDEIDAPDWASED